MEQKKIDFSTITACGESCEHCKKKREGSCPGCIAADGLVPEWAESGGCRIHACAKAHHARFCGVCEAFPCDQVKALMPWNEHCIEELSALAEQYKKALL